MAFALGIEEEIPALRANRQYVRQIATLRSQ
jgi:hypothetical protein